MELFQFACPHCSEPFEVEDPAAGGEIACPFCGEPVALPDELPSGVSEIGDLEGPKEELAAPAGEPSPAPFIPFDFRDASTSGLRPRGSTRKRLTRSERLHRQQRRSLVMMVLGLAVLFIAVLVLNRF